MNKKYFPLIIGFCALIVIILMFVLRFGGEILRNTEVLVSGSSISLESQIPDKNLDWQDKEALEKIAKKLEIFEKGIRDTKTYQNSPVKSIKIIRTPTDPGSFKNIDKENNTISSGSYKAENGVLTLNIYVNDPLAPNGDSLVVFNQKVIELLTILSLTTPSGRGEQSTTIEQRMQYFYDILNEYFGDGKQYPIKVS